MIKVIAALGNPGKSYERTRHNAGWILLDEWARQQKATWKVDRKFNAQVTTVGEGKDKILLIKPLTFMNLSGLAVGAFLRFYKLQPEQLLVIHDEVAFDSGSMKISFEGGPGGHNGIASLIQELGTQGFWRLRLGIGPKPAEFVLSDYVLGKLDEFALKWLKTEKSVANISLIIDIGPVKAQNDMNQNIT